jgi:hypothetical protein
VAADYSFETGYDFSKEIIVYMIDTSVGSRWLKELDFTVAGTAAVVVPVGSCCSAQAPTVMQVVESCYNYADSAITRMFAANMIAILPLL